MTSLPGAILALALVLAGAAPARAMSVDAQVRLLGGFQPRPADLADPAVQAVLSSPAWRRAAETRSLQAVLRDQASMPRLRGDRRRPSAGESPRQTLFSAASRAQMGEFFARNLGPAGTETRNLLYLFGGPDAVYPNLLFPNLERLVLVGLERPGRIHSPEALAGSGRLEGMMGRVAVAFNSLMRMSYFITTAMAKDLSEFGTSTMIAVGLAASGFEILAVEPVAIEPGGTLRVAETSGGVRVRFRKPDGREGDVTYIRMDLGDRNLERNPDFLRFLERSRFDTAYYKAASFVSSNRLFDRLNRFVIGQVRHVVQNDDGLPLRAFRDTAPAWRLRLFGHYTAPHRQFGTDGPQDDLRATSAATLCRTGSKRDRDLWEQLWKDGCRGGAVAYDFAAADWVGPVPFRYGYAAISGPRIGDPDRFSTLMTFDRK